MTQKCSKYTEKFISQFVDNEWGPAKTLEFSSHLDHCPDCAGQVARLQKLANVFEAHTTAQVQQKTSYMAMEHPGFARGILNRFNRFIRGGMTDHLYIKLASLTAVAVLLILAVFQGNTPMGPSAIVKFLDTNASSVMIIETEKEKHTIIWFSET